MSFGLKPKPLTDKNRYTLHEISVVETTMTYAVLFDLDETLLDRSTSLRAFLADQFQRYEIELGEVLYPVWETKFLELDARGHVHKFVVYPKILSLFGGTPSIAYELLEDYRTRCCTHARPFEGMTETLSSLRARNIALGLITNGETAFQTRHIHALGLDRLMDVILISEAEGLRKPDAAIFHRALNRLKIAPERAMFIGDNPAVDIMGAHSAGLKTAWFSAGQSWPDHLPLNPGHQIDRLSQVLDLVPSQKSDNTHAPNSSNTN